MSTVRGSEWHARTLRAWHLAVLRYAVTLDNADRLAVLRIAREIDGLDTRQDGARDFTYFQRTSADLCAAILHPDEHSSTVLRQYLARIDDDRLKRVFAAAIDMAPSTISPTVKPVRRGNELWKGLASRGGH